MAETAWRLFRVGNLGFHYSLADSAASERNLVLVHGSLVDVRSWDRHVEAFSRRFKTLAYSRRYNYPNLNSWSGEDHSVAIEAEDLASLLRGLQLVPARIVAHSLGAYVALYLAIQEPGLVHSLVLSEPPVLPLLRTSEPSLQQLYDEHMTHLWEPVRKAWLRKDREAAVRSTIAYFQGEGQYDRFPLHLRQALLDNSLEWEAIAFSRDPFSVIPEDSIRALRVPALLLQGERSLPFFKAITDRILELNPAVRITVIEDAGHEMWDSHPGDCRRAGLRFLLEMDRQGRTRTNTD
ncbi:MAG: alpha/beta hydrolase [Acidobacteria bacterium]|nr:MAG: alpha/beta hydrolase [Acidobacteriota bacterium]